MQRRVSLSRCEARRIACAAQGLDRPRPAAEPDRRHFRRLMATLRILQLDFVNVLAPAHYLVAWTRLGAYRADRFHEFVYGNGTYTEHWAHEACIIPGDYWPVLAYRRRAYEPWKQNPLNWLEDERAYLDSMLDRIRTEGALTASDFEDPLELKRKAGQWHRSVPRHALELHFGHGRLSVDTRMGNFQRRYDLPSRVLPGHHHLPPVETAEAQRLLLADAARALGVGTVHDLADYFRMSPRDARPRIEELVEAGILRSVRVEGWSETAYLADTARLPRSIPGGSVVSPFDPLVWYRPRTERLFDFRYRIEIYVPEAKREWGYYVLPFRLGDRLAGRLDLKADRKARRLLVQRSYVEESMAGRADEVATAMSGELHDLAAWLGLERIHVARHNPFSRRLQAATSAVPPERVSTPPAWSPK